METLAIEAETAMCQLDISVQNYYRHAVVKNLNSNLNKWKHKSNNGTRYESNIKKI